MENNNPWGLTNKYPFITDFSANWHTCNTVYILKSAKLFQPLSIDTILLRIDGGGIVVLQKVLKHFHYAQKLNGTKYINTNSNWHEPEQFFSLKINKRYDPKMEWIYIYRIYSSSSLA